MIKGDQLWGGPAGTQICQEQLQSPDRLLSTYCASRLLMTQSHLLQPLELFPFHRWRSEVIAASELLWVTHTSLGDANSLQKETEAE